MMIPTRPRRSREARTVLEVWLPLLFFAFLGCAWYHVLRLRERAIAQARRLCERHGLQLLDDSVALHRLRVSWRRGALHALREYRFDTSLGGNDRRIASMTLLGDRVVSASLPDREGSEHASAQVPMLHISPPSHQPGSGDNVIPITRARRTLR